MSAESRGTASLSTTCWMPASRRAASPSTASWKAGKVLARDWLVLGFCSLALSGCRPALDERECAQLLDHYTEKVIEQTRPSAKPAERAKLVGEARLKAARDPEFARCSDTVKRSQFECALAAPDADGVERCLL